MSSVWAIKHRPSFDEIEGQNKVKTALKGMHSHNMPHCLFHSTQPGTGKTSMALAMSVRLKIPVHQFNASSKRTRGIEFVEEDLSPMARSGMQALILLDEADQLTSAAQMALKGVMENSSCIFILATNNLSKINPAIQSRCTLFKFDNVRSLDWLTKIAMREGVEINGKQLEMIREAHDGDLRSAVNALQVYHSIDDEYRDKFLLSLSTKGFNIPLFFEHINDKSFSSAFPMLQSEGNLRTVLKEIMYYSIKNIPNLKGRTTSIITHIATAYRDLQIGVDEEIVMADFAKNMVVSAPL
jgi:DNA polymerase III delta prime subunit